MFHVGTSTIGVVTVVIIEYYYIFLVFHIFASKTRVSKARVVAIAVVTYNHCLYPSGVVRYGIY